MNKLLLLFLLLFSPVILAEDDLYQQGKAYYYGDYVVQDYTKAFSIFFMQANLMT